MATEPEEQTRDVEGDDGDRPTEAQLERMRLMELAASFLKGGRPISKEEEEEEPYVNVKK